MSLVATSISAMLEITYRIEHWPIAGSFTIARGAKTEAVVIVVEIKDGMHTGRGECVPYARYGESIDSVSAQIMSVASFLSEAPDRLKLLHALPGGAARNALDCALWDLESKKSGQRACQLAGIKSPVAAITCYTISLGTPETMFENAKAAAHRPLLKIKLGSPQDITRLAAVRRGAPDSRLVVDANEGWTVDNISEMLRACADTGVELVEQPLPEKLDSALQSIPHIVPLCADESFHTARDIPRIAACYDAVNIKLDKTGGLTEGLSCAAQAKYANLDIMVGCMVGTSLGMAPAILLTPFAKYVDLDGPLLLAKDRDEGLKFDGSLVHPPTSTLWG
jgi:L-Ala-D/L-Glu epimerase